MGKAVCENILRENHVNVWDFRLFTSTFRYRSLFPVVDNYCQIFIVSVNSE